MKLNFREVFEWANYFFRVLREKTGFFCSQVAKVFSFSPNRDAKLPEDIIFEIFSWLPAKSIYKFKSCSKSIYEFTKETYFTLKQSQNSMIKPDSCFFIQQHFFASCFNKTEIHALPGEEASSGVPTTFLQFLIKSTTRILASSNGLLLCQRVERGIQLFICNPVTQSCLYIPTPQNLLENPYFTFAFECNNNGGVDFEEYKLFLLEYNLTSLSFNFKIYMPKEGMWKAREVSFFVGDWSMNDLPVFHNGGIFVLGRSSLTNNPDLVPHIAVYHLETGISRLLKLPKGAIENAQNLYHDMSIFKWGKVGSSNESICVVRLDEKFVFAFWVLTNFESSSWSRFLTISLKEMELNSIVLGFTVMNGDSLVFATGLNVYRYDLVGHRNKKLENICEHGFESNFRLYFTSYSNALRSCGPGATTLPLPRREETIPQFLV